MAAKVLTVGGVGRQLGVPTWQVRRAIERKFLDEPERLGCYRIFRTADLPRIRAALVRAGYLDSDRKAVAHAD